MGKFVKTDYIKPCNIESYCNVDFIVNVIHDKSTGKYTMLTYDNYECEITEKMFNDILNAR